jgi:hypothetical protein
MRVPMPRNATKSVKVISEGFELALEAKLFLQRQHAEPPPDASINTMTVERLPEEAAVAAEPPQVAAEPPQVAAEPPQVAASEQTGNEPVAEGQAAAAGQTAERSAAEGSAAEGSAAEGSSVAERGQADQADQAAAADQASGEQAA